MVGNNILEMLDVGDNEITKEGCLNIAKILNLTSIKILKIYNNVIGEQGIMDLANECFLYDNRSLERIDASGCRISD